MLKNLEIWPTEKCNSRCLICHKWQNTDTPEFKTAELAGLLARKEFVNVESVQLSGGEPMLRQDITDVAEAVIGSLPRLNSLLVATNGLEPEKTAGLFMGLARQTDITLKLCVSLEGDRKNNRKIRGIDSYDSVINTIKLCRESLPSLRINILTTLTHFNCTAHNLRYMHKLASSLKCEFSYRPYYDSATHHHGKSGLEITDRQKQAVINFTNQFYRNDPFLKTQSQYLRTGLLPSMDKCLAGNIFANIRSNGDIFPCVNSTRKIGNLKEGARVNRITDRGRFELCPCCDEVSFYPMHNYFNK